MWSRSSRRSRALSVAIARSPTMPSCKTGLMTWYKLSPTSGARPKALHARRVSVLCQCVPSFSPLPGNELIMFRDRRLISGLGFPHPRLHYNRITHRSVRPSPRLRIFSLLPFQTQLDRVSLLIVTLHVLFIGRATSMPPLHQVPHHGRTRTPPVLTALVMLPPRSLISRWVVCVVSPGRAL